MAYGIKLRDHATLAQAETAALERRRSYGWQGDVLFRVSAVSYAQSDEWGDYYSSGPVLEIETHAVSKWTPCGARSPNRRGWIDLRPGHKQWASRDVVEALNQFLARRKGQIHILERQLSRAREEHDLAYGALQRNDLKDTLYDDLL